MNGNINIETWIPRWHYRDTQKAVREIIDTANATGNLRAVMVEYIAARGDKLPEGISVENAADAILETVNGFTVAHSEGKTAEDIKAALQDAIRGMDSRQALAYLSTLEFTFRSCDVSAASNASIPNPDELQEEICQSIEGAYDDCDVSARINRLAEMILGNSLNAYVYASGNDKLTDFFRDTSNNISDSYAASKLHEMLLDNTRKADLYAATACVCYGMLLDSKVKGSSGGTIEPEVVTALASAGMEKASITARFMRGEIDRELVSDMLDALAKSLKWFFIKLFQAGMFAFGSLAGFAVLSWISATIGITLSAWFLLPVSFIVGMTLCITSEEVVEEMVDVLGYLSKAAILWVWDAVSWVWNKGREIVRHATNSNTVGNTTKSRRYSGNSSI